jgi:hypothetical protein
VADSTRLGQELAKLEQEDPKIRAAAERYEKATREILATPPFQEEDMASFDELNKKLVEHHKDGSPPLELSPAEVRRLLYVLWEKRGLERDSDRYRLINAFSSLLNVHRGETVVFNDLRLFSEEEREWFDLEIEHIQKNAVREHTRTVQSMILAAFGPKSLDCPKDPACGTCARCQLRALLE